MTIGVLGLQVVSNEQLNALINAPKDDRTKKLSTQARKLGIQAHRSTVRRALLELRNAGMRKAALQKEITDDQAIQRAQYTLDKRFWPIEGYWYGVVFTDEAHMALDDFPQEWILRVIGERFHPKKLR